MSPPRCLCRVRGENVFALQKLRLSAVQKGAEEGQAAIQNMACTACPALLMSHLLADRHRLGANIALYYSHAYAYLSLEAAATMATVQLNSLYQQLDTDLCSHVHAGLHHALDWQDAVSMVSCMC